MNIDEFLGFPALFMQFYLYIYTFSTIRAKKLPWKFIILFMIFELVRGILLGPGSTALILVELYLISRKLLKDNDKEKSFFYASYAYYFTLVFTLFFSLFFQEFLPMGILLNYPNLLWLISILLTFSIHKWLFKSLKLDVSVLSDEDEFVSLRIIKPMNRTLAIAVFVLILVQILEIVFNFEDVSQYTKYLIFAYIFLIVSFLILLSNKITAYHEEIFKREKAEQFQRLTLYTKEVEQMYQTVRGFKHDYKNMLISLEDSIRTGDIDAVRLLFHEILMKANIAISEGENIDDLSHFDNPALKSLLYHKFTQARQEGVTVNIEIKQEVKDVQMDLLNFVRVISVLLDNALEAAKETLAPEISFALVKQGNGHILFVNNNKLPGIIPIHKIYQKGFTTKGEGRGTGLFSVAEILDKLPRTSIETEQSDTMFTQIVSIGV